MLFQNDQELDGVEKEPLAGRGLAAALRVAFQKGYVDGKLASKVPINIETVPILTNLSLEASKLMENTKSEFRLKVIQSKIKIVWTILINTRLISTVETQAAALVSARRAR